MGSRRWVVVVLALLLGFGFVAAAPAPNDEVDRLIQELGSPHFRQREAASRALEAVGTPALEPLRKATKSDDIEIRRRAEALVRILERRAEADEILQPTRIKLSYKDTPVLEALEDFKTKSGYSSYIRLEGDTSLFEHRRITLETGELSYWEALDKFCEAADLKQEPLKPKQVRNPQVQNGRDAIPGLVLQQPANPGPPAPGGGGVVLSASNVTLVDGKSATYPTTYHGAIRIRAVPAATQKVAGETAVVLEVALEPKLRWTGLAGVFLDKAVDDRNQALGHVSEDGPLGTAMQGEQVWLAANGPGQVAMIQGPNGMMILQNGQYIDGNGVNYLKAGSIIGQQVRLKLPENAGKTIRLLRGVTLAQVQTPMQPTITVDDINQTLNKAQKGKDGAELTIDRVTKQENGAVIVQVQLMPGMNSLGASVNNVQVGRTGDKANAMQPWTLYDDQKDDQQKAYKLISQRAIGYSNEGAQIIQLMFAAQDKQQTPKKLVYATARLTTIEVPFEVRDLPMQ